MTNLTGETLHDRLAREGQLAPREAVRIGASLGRYLVQLHRRGLRDCPIAPANILVHAGDARLLEAENALLTRDYQPYRSPEEAAGKPADELTDIYRLGALMYHMLTGSPPPEPEPASRLATAGKLRPPAPPPSVHAVRRDVSRSLDQAITRALARDPRDRFARASQFAEILEDALTQRLDHQPHSDRPSQVAIVDSFEFGEDERRAAQLQTGRRRRRLLLLVLLALAVAAWAYLG